MKRTELNRKTPLKRTGFSNKEKNPLKRTPLKKQSARRKSELAEYRERKREYFSHLRKEQVEEGLNPPENAPWCEVCVAEGWDLRPAIDWHHVLPLGRGGRLNQPWELMLAVSRHSHDKIHGNMKWAEGKGYLLRG